MWPDTLFIQSVQFQLFFSHPISTFGSGYGVLVLSGSFFLSKNFVIRKLAWYRKLHVHGVDCFRLLLSLELVFNLY